MNDLFKNIIINFREVMEEYKWCINDIPHFFLIMFSKKLIKTCVLH